MSEIEVCTTAVIGEANVSGTTPAEIREIAGYQLLERIGVGGFGEVWRALGPGGFPKAVKILFGNLSGPQAETELKALNRMRELRHPFLLNIERVEIVDGRAIVVSELADRSLDQRFRDLIRSGQRGVARDELLRYLRDAADALDFMSEEHGLQHLDIKPENLLLQGAHAKVGDFGLTKLVGHVSQSQVNGFTPLYAPPELFEGRPDRGSDQYSLAIVYQTMLTGTPPFNGRTASQLMAQHLKSSPDLSSLLPSDRAVVSRALSKNPRTRFSSCRQFIDELAKRRPTKSLSNHASSGSAPPVHASSTCIASTENITSNHSMLHGTASPLAPIKSLPEDLLFRPTLFVGVGGLGCQAVVRLSQCIQHRFSKAKLSAMQYLCIDTDNASVTELQRRSSHGGRVVSTVSAPLRTSQEYRKESSDHLTWLGRRWLFNIPRSGRVEGMRPLGRLAFVDHVADIRTELKNCLMALLNGESLKQTAAETGLPFDTSGIDVCLVGSISGGTSSGCIMDVAWLIRELAANGRMLPVRLTSVVMHGTANNRQSADMQDANTVSFLQELQHFSVTGAQQPGLTSRFSHSDTSKPFDETTFVHFGDDLSESDFSNGVNRTVEYLELRTLTSARQEFNAWRSPERTQIPECCDTTLRSFGLASVNADVWDVASSGAVPLATAALNLWANGAPSADAEPDSPDCTSLLQQLGINDDAILQMIPSVLDSGRTRRMDEYSNSIWERLSQDPATPLTEHITNIIRQDTAAQSTTPNSIAVLIEEIRSEQTSRLPEVLQLTDTFLSQLLEKGLRPHLADQAITALIRHTSRAIAACENQQNDIQNAFHELCDTYSVQFPDQQKNMRPARRGVCRQYCMLFTCQAICRFLIERLQAFRKALPQLHEERFVPLRDRLSLLATQIDHGVPNTAVIPYQMVEAFETYLQASRRFKTSSLLERDPSPADAALLQSEANNFLLSSMSENPQFSDDQYKPKRGESFPLNARPKLGNVGGGQRVLAIIPNHLPAENWKTMLKSDFGGCVSVCGGQTDRISVVCEIEGISIPAAIDALTHMRP
ncbi:MAG: protein kinase, partial [Planctomycetota bacterium]|nr:protein kinase [Planctomycetota bacterium]